MGKFVEFVMPNGVRFAVRADAVVMANGCKDGNCSVLDFGPAAVDGRYEIVRGTLDEVVAKLSGDNAPRPALHPTTQAMLNAMAAASQPGLSQAEAHELTSRAIDADDAWVAAGCPDAEAVQS